MPRTRTADLNAWMLAMVLVASGPLGAQQRVEEEDLPEPDVWEEAIPTYVEAEKVFNSRNQPDAVALFDDFLRQVETNRAIDEPPDEIHRLVANSHFYRAQVNFNLGTTDEVQADLERLLAIEPGFAMDRTLVSSKFAELFDRVKKQHVGAVLFAVDPPDAEISVGRFRAGLDGMLQLPIGTHVVRIARPGYGPAEQEVVASSNDVPTFQVKLERLAAVLTIYTAQEDVAIEVDGAPRGATSPYPGADPAQGSRLVLDDLQPGTYELGASKEGFRDYLARAQIAELRDYVVGPIELAPTAGTIVLRDLPPGTAVRANDDIVTPTFAAGAAPQLTLSPGSYRLALSHPDLGLLEADVVIEDQETETISVRLRPPIVLLGVLGGDEQSARRLESLLAGGLAAIRRYAFIDRSGSGQGILSSAAVEVQGLRAFAQTGSRQVIPWDRIRAEADQRAKGALYLLAVLSDDLLASRAHVFVFPQAPLPARPDVIDLALSAEDVARLKGLLDRSVIAERAALGAVVVDAPTAAGPVVVSVSPGGSAEVSGLRAGDEIVAIDGAAVTSVAELQSALEARIESHARTGQTVPLDVSSADGTRQVALGFSTSPVILGLRETDILYSAAGHELQSEEQDGQSLIPKWVVALNQAVVHLHGGDRQGAIRFLREVKAPEGGRLGQGMVDYLMGLALSGAGGDYTATAKEFLAKAAADTESRLFHVDGPFIAPRAQARLRVLN